MFFFFNTERIKASEQKFSHLREVYQKLRTEHITLLRSNGETQKKLTKTEKDLLNEETSRMVRAVYLLSVYPLTGHVCLFVCLFVLNLRNWRNRFPQ